MTKRKKAKSTKSKSKIIISLVVLLGIVVTSVAVFITQSMNTAPVFSFDESKAPGWWSSGNLTPRNDIDPDQYDEAVNGPVRELPVADIIINHGGPNDKPTEDRCFVSLSYYDHPLDDVAQAYDSFEQRMNKWGSSKHIDSIKQTISTSEGDKSYELRRYRTSVDGSNEGDYMSGNQIGYVALDGGYLRINGVCQTPEHLDLTLSPLAAVEISQPR